MKKSVFLIAIAVLLSLNLSVLAQDEEIEKDFMEINMFGGLNVPSSGISDWNDSLGAKTGYGMGFDIGYFVTIKFVAGIKFNYSEYGIDNSPTDSAATDLTHRLYSPGIYAKYYFMPESNWQPYVKGHIGIDYPKFTTFVTNPAGDRYRQLSYDPALAYGIGVGLFRYTSDFGGFFVEANYHYAKAQDVEADYEGNIYTFGENISTLDIHAGVRIMIGSGD